MSSEKDLILIVSIDGYKFSININDLIEVTESLDISSSCSMEECLGKVKFRGTEIPLVDIKKRLALPDDGKPKSGTAAVVRIWDEVIALPIDSVEGVFESGTTVFPFPQLMLKEETVFTHIHEWNDEFVFFMNLPGIFSKEVIAKLSGESQKSQ